jgi:hypothetical protein
MIDDGDCGAVGGMKIGRGNRSTRRKPAPVSLCPSQIPHEQTWARTRVAAERSQRLTAWAMARSMPECWKQSANPTRRNIYPGGRQIKLSTAHIFSPACLLRNGLCIFVIGMVKLDVTIWLARWIFFCFFSFFFFSFSLLISLLWMFSSALGFAAIAFCIEKQ